jgi:hypothetical protein
LKAEGQVLKRYGIKRNIIFAVGFRDLNMILIKSKIGYKMRFVYGKFELNTFLWRVQALLSVEHILRICADTSGQVPV